MWRWSSSIRSPTVKRSSGIKPTHPYWQLRIYSWTDCPKPGTGVNQSVKKEKVHNLFRLLISTGSNIRPQPKTPRTTWFFWQVYPTETERLWHCFGLGPGSCGYSWKRKSGRCGKGSHLKRRLNQFRLPFFWLKTQNPFVYPCIMAKRVEWGSEQQTLWNPPITCRNTPITWRNT